MKKNILNIFYLALSMVVVFSCDPDKVDDDYLDGLKVYTNFERSTLVVPVLEGLDNSQTIVVQVTTPTATSGLSVSVDEDSVAEEGVDFTLDTSQLVLNEGQVEGYITVDPIFETAVLEGKSFILNLTSTDDEIEVLGNRQIEVTLEKQCPVADDYMVGEYTISDVQATIGPANGTPNFGGTVTISVGSSSTSRVFETNFLPGFGTPLEEIELSLVCGNLFLNTSVNTALSCNGGASFLGFAPDPEANMTYSDDDDSSFVINYIEDSNVSCGGPFNSSFILTKVN